MEATFETLIAEAVGHASQARGWDFSYLDGRRHSEAPPWSYEGTVLSHLDGLDTMLDMDTGGGEKLRSLFERAATWPEKVIATEGYPPNVKVAGDNLGSIGVEVVRCDDADVLPFDDASFDLVLNRHGRYLPPEVARILRNDGVFITEQVGSDMCMGLNRLLDAPRNESPVWGLEGAVAEIEKAGFEIVIREEHRGRDVFDDVGAVVWYLTMVHTQIPEFSVEAYRDRLRGLHGTIQQSGPLDAGNHHFLVVAYKRDR